MEIGDTAGLETCATASGLTPSNRAQTLVVYMTHQPGTANRGNVNATLQICVEGLLSMVNAYVSAASFAQAEHFDE